MVNKRDLAAPAPEAVIPELPKSVVPSDFYIPADLDLSGYDPVLAGSDHLWDDYAVGERIDHVDAMTLEEAEHQMATRLYQNTAKVHFNQHQAGETRFGKRIVYGGVVISTLRALSFNGLANAFRIAAINGGRHANPSFAGDTIYGWSEVLEKIEVPGRRDLGALRLRSIATKDRVCRDFPREGSDGKLDPAVVLDLDYTVLMPRRA
jgi:2-methylfumaryl-CoA hydratase